MIQCATHDITFQEVPDEVSLTLSISNCEGNCKSCHSPWLRESIGYDLEDMLPVLLDLYKESVTCVCFMGEGNDPHALLRCIRLVKAAGLKICLYSGRDHIANIPLIDQILPLLDYLKVGRYIEPLGGLDSPSTNQQFYAIDQEHMSFREIGYRFWKDYK